MHVSIKFTHEIEVNSSLPFLDLTVAKHEDRFSTGVFRKATYTKLGMKYDSAITHGYKVSLIKCLIDRAYKLCSTWMNFTIDLEFLLEHFSVNGFPLRLVQERSKKYLDAKFHKKTACATVSKKLIYCSIPYMSADINYMVKSKINSILPTCYPQLEMKLIFRNNFTIGCLFRVSNRIPNLVRSNVYLYT